MTSRKLLWVLLGAALVCAPVVRSAVRTGPRPESVRIAEGARLVRPGMTYAGVVRALGAPEGDYRTDPDEVVYVPSPYLAKHGYRFWVSDPVLVAVLFDIEGRAIRVHTIEPAPVR